MIDIQTLQAAKAAKRSADLARQADSREFYKGWRIQIAIGRTGGADNVGVELWMDGEKEHYFSNPGEAKAWVDKRPVMPLEDGTPGDAGAA